MALQGDLIIHDEEYKKFGQLMETMNYISEKHLESLLEVLETVYNDGIKAGHVHDNLGAFIDRLCRMKGQFRIFTESYQKLAYDFITDVEIADKDFYIG